MGFDRLKRISRALLVAVLLAGIASFSTSSFISDGLLDSSIGSFTGRSLLQAKKSCEVNFEFMNYTIITSRCKGPKYPRDPCCDSFLQFACPYADEINDLTTDCAEIMFSYINLYGSYPPGLFANQCQGDKVGIRCPDNYTRSSRTTAVANGGSNPAAPSSHRTLVAASTSFFVFLLLLALF